MSRAEVQALREEVADLRELVRELGRRLARVELGHPGFERGSGSAGSGSFCLLSDRPAVLGDSQPPLVSASSSRADRDPEPSAPGGDLRIEVARSIGEFSGRCLRGEPRGTSGRSRLSQQSRYYIVCRDFRFNLYDPPIICTSFAECKRLCFLEGECGDSIYVGVPSLGEARVAVETAGLIWRAPARS